MSAPGVGQAARVDHTFVRKLWGDCWINLPGLLGANSLLLLWCLPAAAAGALQFWGLAMLVAPITVGPALVGLFAYVANLALDQPASFWRDGLRGLRSGSGGVLWVGIGIVGWMANQVALRHAMDCDLSSGAVALWAGQGVVCLTLWVAAMHAVGLSALYRQGVKEALRNAVLLTFAYPGSTSGLLGAGLLLGLLTRLLGGGPLIIAPALYAVLAVNTTLLLVQRNRA